MRNFQKKSASLWVLLSKAKRFAALWFIFGLSTVVHLMLDTIVGEIWWLAPFVDKPYSLFHVPTRFKPWWLSFILHWSMLLEIAVIVGAVVCWRRRRNLGHPFVS